MALSKSILDDAVLLSEPGKTAYDLKFNLLGFPCRVHPAFFVLPVLFSRSFVSGNEMNVGLGVIIIAAVFFLGVLVHELGHTPCVSVLWN